MRFTMPYDSYLEIRPNIDIDADPDEEIEGVIYSIAWVKRNSVTFIPHTTKTRTQAVAIALGCQHGAYHV
jgi:hypothetical protein